MRSVGAIVLALCVLAACGEDEPEPLPTGLEGLSLSSVEPRVVLPGTVLHLEGGSFLGEPLGRAYLRLRGAVDGRDTTLDLPATFVDYETMTVDIAAAPATPTDATFEGWMSARVEFVPAGTHHFSAPLSGSLEFRDSLQPELHRVAPEGAIHVNAAIEVDGSGFLLGGPEGTMFAVVEGCTVPLGAETCSSPTRVELPVTPAEPFSRVRGVFPFSPAIAGIDGGRFEGRVHLANVLPDGSRLESESLPVVFELLEPTVTSIGDGGSVGQYVDIEGGGFVGEEDGITLMELDGEFFLDDDVGGIPVAGLSFIPEFADGSRMRFVMNEQDALARALEDHGGIRYAAGTFDGTIRPVVTYDNQSVTGAAIAITFEVRPVKQVVWVQFDPSYVESLRKFGVRAADARIRDRVLEVMRRDYATINVDFRVEEPTDFAEYTVLEIHGPDLNEESLFGYDNTFGKDIDNLRLSDRIGGINAMTQELSGYPGYGGVFIETFLAFSEHPPPDVESLGIGNPLFDQIFDEFRPDRGRPLRADDELGGEIPILTNAANCPTDDRRLQAGCAVWALGSLIGSTASHELGHALGLAEPTLLNRFHYATDGDARLMDKGAFRPFEERAELMGQGPAAFCDVAYAYLRRILPTDGPMQERPPCE